MKYTVYIRNDNEWLAWSCNVSYDEALHMAEYLRNNEGLEALVA